MTVTILFHTLSTDHSHCPWGITGGSPPNAAQVIRLASFVESATLADNRPISTGIPFFTFSITHSIRLKELGIKSVSIRIYKQQPLMSHPLYPTNQMSQAKLKQNNNYRAIFANTICSETDRNLQGDHSPYNVKFPDRSRHTSVALGMLSVTHIKPVLVLNTCMDSNMQLTINSFRQLLPDNIFSLTIPWFLVKSLTFPWQLSNSLTFPVFPDKWSRWI